MISGLDTHVLYTQTQVWILLYILQISKTSKNQFSCKISLFLCDLQGQCSYSSAKSVAFKNISILLNQTDQHRESTVTSPSLVFLWCLIVRCLLNLGGGILYCKHSWQTPAKNKSRKPIKSISKDVQKTTLVYLSEKWEHLGVLIIFGVYPNISLHQCACYYTLQNYAHNTKLQYQNLKSSSDTNPPNSWRAKTSSGTGTRQSHRADKNRRGQSESSGKEDEIKSSVILNA